MTTARLLGVLGMTGLALAGPASGLNIVLNYNAFLSVEPAIDSTGAGLIDLFQQAETYYQDIFEDSHTLTVNFYYTNLPGGKLGEADQVSHDGLRTSEVTIRMDNRETWFIDPTPESDFEFTMQQVLWRDLTPTQQSDWYNGGSNIAETFEAGFGGVANTGNAADGLTDMYSVVIHEIGHAIGMSNQNPTTVTQTNDGDYDFSTNLTNGVMFAAETANDSGDDNLNIAHIENTNTLMAPSIPASTRRLPSHTDLLSMASGSLFFTLDVPRREMYGPGDWNINSKWSGGQVPGTDDSAIVRDADGSGDMNVFLSANGFTNDLEVTEGADVSVGGNKLDVNGTLLIDGLGSTISVSSGGELEVDGSISIDNGAELELLGGAVEAVASAFQIDSQSKLTSLLSTNNVFASTLFSNEGTIQALFGSTLILNTTSTDPWQLDGFGRNGEVRAQSGNIIVDSGAFAQSFGGAMRVGGGHYIRIDEPWTNIGLIDLNGGATFADRARLLGATVVNATNGEIEALGLVDIDAPVVADGGETTVEVNSELNFNGFNTIIDGTYVVNTGGALDFNGPTLMFNANISTPGPGTAGLATLDGTTSYNGGAIALAGVLQQNGNADVNNDVTVTGGYFDMDGSSGTTQWTIDAALTLIDVAGIENSTISNAFNGTLNINNAGSPLGGGGVLDVTLQNRTGSWDMAGTANLDGSVPGTLPFITIIPTMIKGDDVTISGTLNMQDRGAIGARATISGNVSTIDSNSRLSLLGGGPTSGGDTNRMAGGAVGGPGILSSSSGHALIGFGTINSRIEFFDDSDLLADDGQLIINSTILDVGVIGTADSDGILNVTLPWNANTADVVELNGGSILGANVINGTLADPGLIRGFGTFAPNQVVNDGTIAASGGQLVINTTFNPDLDGGSNTGVIAAEQGDLFVQDEVTDLFDGTASVGQGRTMTFAGGWQLSSGVLNMAGDGTPAGVATVAGLSQVLRGTVNVTNNAAFDLPTTFFSTSTTNLTSAGDTLVLQQDAAVQAGASFTGNGSLVNESGATLTLEDGASLGVKLINDGLLHLAGTDAGNATVSSFEQSQGTLHIDLDAARATPPRDFLSVTGSAELGGTLELSLINGFVPTPYTPVTILTSGGLNGSTFDMLSGANYAPGRVLAVSYTATDVIITEAIHADLDLDGDVDGVDLSLFFSSFTGPGGGPAGNPQADLDGDGDVDGVDLSTAFTAFTGPLNPTNVPEPGALALLVMSGFIATQRRRK